MQFTGLVAGLFCVVLVSQAPAQNASKRATEQLALGIAASNALDPAGALRHFQSVLMEDSLNYEAHWRAALALLDIGKRWPDKGKNAARDSVYQLAEAHARRAVGTNPDGANGHFALANALGRASLTKGNKERIKQAAEIRTEALRAIELDPRHDGAYHILGRWNAELMRVSGLQRFFAKNFLGADLFDQASWEAAIMNLEKAVELDPTRVYHHVDLADIYIDRRRYADARTQLEAVASLPERDVMDSAYKKDAVKTLQRIANKHDKH